MRRSDIWSKLVGTLDDFDLEYPWDDNKAMSDGQLELPNRDSSKDQSIAGLRDLYCFWRDYTLANIESKAADWLTAATANYRTEFGAAKNNISPLIRLHLRWWY